MPRFRPSSFSLRPSMIVAAAMALSFAACASAKEAPAPASAPVAPVPDAPAASAPAGNALEQRAAASATRPESVIGVDWLFTWVRGFSGNTAELVPLPGLILVPEGRTLSGNSSCNRFRAGYLHDAATGRLSFSNLVNTRMMCQRANAEAENAILAALLATDAYRIVDGRLELRSKGEVVARLVAK